MPKRPYEWRVDSHGCYKIDKSALGLGPRDQSAHLPVFLHLRNTDILGLIALCEVSRPSKEDLNADATKNVGRDEVLVCALVNQGVNDASIHVHTCSSCSLMLSDRVRILICFF